MLALFLAALAAMGVDPVWAHSYVVSSDPGSGETVAGPVDEVTLEFDLPVTEVSVTLTGPLGDISGTTELVAERRARFSMNPQTTGGQYLLRYEAISSDGDVTNGVFEFTIGDAATTSTTTAPTTTTSSTATTTTTITATTATTSPGTTTTSESMPGSPPTTQSTEPTTTALSTTDTTQAGSATSTTSLDPGSLNPGDGSDTNAASPDPDSNRRSGSATRWALAAIAGVAAAGAAIWVFLRSQN